MYKKVGKLNVNTGFFNSLGGGLKSIDLFPSLTIQWAGDFEEITFVFLFIGMYVNIINHYWEKTND